MRSIILLFHIVLYLSYNSILLGQNVICRLVVDSTSIDIVEPVSYKILIENSANDPVTIIQPWNDYFGPQLEYRYTNESNWEALPQSNYRQKIHSTNIFYNPPQALQLIQLEPGEIISDRFMWVPFLEREELLKIFTADEIYLRASINHDSSTIITSANAVKILIADHETEQDSIAQQWLLTNDVPSFVYEVLKYGHMGWGRYSLQHPDVFCQTTFLVETFSTSKYANWAKLHLALYYYTGYANLVAGRGSPDNEKVINLLGNLADYPNPQFQEIRHYLLTEIDPFTDW